MEYTGIMNDEKFVGNINTNQNISYLQDVQYRIGELALDIHGNKLDPSYMLPLFVKEQSLGKYDRVMMQILSDIRSGKSK